MNKDCKIFLSLENSFNLFSVSICDGHYCFYNEFFELNLKSDQILKLINNILIKKRISIKNIDSLIYGKGFANFTDLRILLSVIKSFSFGFKIPLLEISSMQAIALEAFCIYKTDIVFVAYFLKDDILCYQFYEKNNIFFKKEYHIKNLNDIIFPKKQFLGIIKTENNNFEYLHKINQNLTIKKFIYPKSIYLDRIARKKIFNNKIDNIINNVPNYVNDVVYKKYKI